MKKTLHLAIIALTAVVCATSFTSCKKSSSSPSLVGTWNLTGGKEISVDSTTTPVTVTTVDTTYAAPYTTLQFNADGSLVLTNTGSPAESGTYFYGQGKIGLTFGGGTPGVAAYTLSGNTLTLIVVDDSEPGVSSETEDLILTRQ
ncbi:MAG TPA: lipocalin family protein [Ferruginibacter sp.]|nr:lipocalin family protein [Ferruginibacter sp.]